MFLTFRDTVRNGDPEDDPPGWTPEVFSGAWAQVCEAMIGHPLCTSVKRVCVVHRVRVPWEDREASDQLQALWRQRMVWFINAGGCPVDPGKESEAGQMFAAVRPVLALGMMRQWLDKEGRSWEGGRAPCDVRLADLRDAVGFAETWFGVVFNPFLKKEVPGGRPAPGWPADNPAVWEPGAWHSFSQVIEVVVDPSFRGYGTTLAMN